VIGHICICAFVGYRVSIKFSLISIHGKPNVLYVFTCLPIYLFIYIEGQSEHLKLYIVELLKESEM
jgi:hypothetical protein